jgi:hypothetical protein
MKLPLIFLWLSFLSGFQSKVDYIQNLGVKGVALSSILKVSAGGSDEAVEDFQDVDPLYGTLAEFKALISSLKNKGKRLNMFNDVNLLSVPGNLLHGKVGYTISLPLHPSKYVLYKIKVSYGTKP